MEDVGKGAYAMQPPTKYEAKVKALEALDCPG